ncbi:hypothetical protein [Blastopirellula marina]|uniref:Zinc finger/thioredoxin putative domain-containing protein n=1 Tax=Blastopirellula marina TaxID=124 RepID=A0A2S8GSX9_9BACT|nr:hypothetical protein [Blastopirellula marina]PQO47532.1 hypothetical protein C5Y93_02410 [Blastopirellula marina]
MPIEFLCTACPKKLRVPDDSAGKKVRCPSCGHLQVIPSPGGGPSMPPAAPPKPPAQTPAPGAAKPIAPKPIAPKPPAKPQPLPPPQGDPFGLSDDSNPFADDAPNPFASPSPAASAPSPYVAPPRRSGNGMSPETAKVLLTIPTAILLAIQAINLLGCVLIIAGAIFLAMNPPRGGQNVDNPEFLWMAMSIGGGIGCLLSLVAMAGLANAILRKSYSFAWVGVILGMLPCSLALNCVTMLLAMVAFPVGIWAIVMLCMPEVKAQFR